MAFISYHINVNQVIGCENQSGGCLAMSFMSMLFKCSEGFCFSKKPCYNIRLSPKVYEVSNEFSLSIFYQLGIY